MLHAVGRVGTNWLNDTRMPDSARSLTADWGGLVKRRDRRPQTGRACPMSNAMIILLRHTLASAELSPFNS